MGYLVHNSMLLNNCIKLELFLQTTCISLYDCGIIQQVYTANQTQYRLIYSIFTVIMQSSFISKDHSTVSNIMFG